MQDELLMRDWTALHQDFTAGLAGGRDKSVGRRQANGWRLDVIDPAYHRESETAASGRPSLRLSPAAQASVSGFVASVITALLWMPLLALALPAEDPALARARAVAGYAYPALA